MARLEIHPPADADYFTKVFDFTEGDPALLPQKYVTPYDTELTAEAQAAGVFSKRVQRSYPVAFSGVYLNEHASHLHQTATVEGFPEDSPLLDDITGFNITLAEFIRNCTRSYLADGIVGILAEGSETVAPDKLKARAAGERSYLIQFPASSILRLEYFKRGPRMGKPKEVVLLEENELGDGRVYARRYTYGTPDAPKFIIEKLRTDKDEKRNKAVFDFEVYETRPGSFNLIPFVAIGRGKCDSILKHNIAFDVALLNKSSSYSNTITFQEFQRIFLFGVNDADELRKIAENRFSVSRDKDAHIEVIEPVLLTSAENEIASLKHLSQRFGMRQFKQLTDEMTKQVSSAESKAADMESLAQFYNDTLDIVQRAFRSALRFITAYEGLSEDGVTILIARDFNLTDSEADDRETQMTADASREFGDAGYALRKALLQERISKTELEQETKDEILALLEAESREVNPLLPAPEKPTLADLVTDAPEADPTAA